MQGNARQRVVLYSLSIANSARDVLLCPRTHRWAITNDMVVRLGRQFSHGRMSNSPVYTSMLIAMRDACSSELIACRLDGLSIGAFARVPRRGSSAILLGEKGPH